MDDSDIEMTPEDENYEPDEYRDPADALMLEPGKANRMNAFLKNNFGRQIVEVIIYIHNITTPNHHYKIN